MVAWLVVHHLGLLPIDGMRLIVACSAITADWVKFLLVSALLCSIRRCSSDWLVWPTYTLGQATQGILYTTPARCCGGMWSLGSTTSFGEPKGPPPPHNNVCVCVYVYVHVCNTMNACMHVHTHCERYNHIMMSSCNACFV